MLSGAAGMRGSKLCVAVALLLMASTAGHAEAIVDVGATYQGDMTNSKLELPWLRFRLTMITINKASKKIGFALLVLDDVLPNSTDDADAKAKEKILAGTLSAMGKLRCVVSGAARDGLPMVKCASISTGGDLAAQLLAQGIARPRIKTTRVLVP
jgi:hypothetical protein